MASVLMAVRVDEEKGKVARRILSKNGMTFSAFVNEAIDQLISDNGSISMEDQHDGKTPQEKMLERMSKPENKDIIKNWYPKFRELQVDRALTKYDTMTKAEITIEKAKARGII